MHNLQLNTCNHTAYGSQVAVVSSLVLTFLVNKKSVDQNVDGLSNIPIAVYQQ